MSLEAPLVVTAPAGAKPLPGGLMNNAVIMTETNPHLANGVAFQGRIFAQAEFLGQLCKDDILALGPQNRNPNPPVVVEAGAFGISQTIECAPGFVDLESMINDAFEYSEGWAVESGFQIGVLNKAATTVIDGTGTKGPVQAMALLEQWAGDQVMGTPMFHVSRFGATHLAANRLTHEDTSFLMKSRQGSPIANSAGQGKTGPGAVAATATQFWLYVSGAVTIYRGGLTVSKALDHQTNKSTVSADRIYVPTYEGAVAAILVGVA